MQYRKDRFGRELSVLGYGCLRFTRRGAQIDTDKAVRELSLAVENGVNYIDTAYVYGGSEECVGQFFERTGLRDRVTLTTKLPHYYVKKREDLDRYFDEELKRLRTDHVDYYLMHMLNDVTAWERLISLGVLEWIEEKKRAGQIRGIGFSFHGGTDRFIELIDSYDWDIAQVQFNYVDEYAQAGIDGVHHAHEKGVPVVIMEPLRGGRLADKLPASAKRVFASCDPSRSPAAWGLRWVMSHGEVTVVLSGMNDEAQILDNVRTANEALPGCLTQQELDACRRAKEAFLHDTKVGCTGCGYCMPCPAGVDIPNCFQAYNLSWSDGLISGLKSYFMCNAMRGKPTLASLCVGCRRCEKHCPQGIHVPDELKKVRRRLENPLFNLARAVDEKLQIFR